ncbi:helix-turn-helix domain-containing protein [Curtobacterium sp. 1544]|uniref:helix-turn-helix domain-containing protein n=1 Tax=Curtobacterium sp. 1544 TaxID=3156417 RepID=UPI00339708A9
MTIALHHSRATGAVKLVLLGIANHDGDGGAWPSIATLAKYAATTPRTVQRSIQQLQRLGEIRRHVNAGGTHMTADYMRPNLYQFLLRCPPTCDRSSRHRVHGETAPVVLFDPPTVASGGDAHVGGTPDAHVGGGATPASPEPSLNRQMKDQGSTKPATDARAASKGLNESIVRDKCKHSPLGWHDWNASSYCNFCGSRREDAPS